MALLECSNIAKNTCPKKTEEKLLGHKWLGSETKPRDPTQWLYWMIPNSIHIALKLLLKSGG